MDHTLDGRRAIVTGGSSGIGRGIAIELAKQGADVVIADITRESKGGSLTPTDQKIREIGRNSVFCRADVSKFEDVEALIETVLDEFDGLDILVNNAGVSHTGTIEETEPSDWDRVMGVNLTGVYNCCHHAIPKLVDSPYPRVINIASQVGLVGRPRRPAYCASKGGVIALTRQLAVDYSDVPILVNAICPGAIRTPLTEPILSDDETRALVDRETLLPYIGEPEDIGSVAAFLASDGSRFMTGQTIIVDGGYTAH